MLGNRKIVFWTPQLSLATFEQAIQVNGKISTVGPREPSEQSIKEYCWKYTPEDLAEHIRSHARPWPEVLSQHLDDLSGPAVEDLLAQLDLDGVDLDAVITQLRRGTRLRVARGCAWRASDTPPKLTSPLILRGAPSLNEITSGTRSCARDRTS